VWEEVDRAQSPVDEALGEIRPRTVNPAWHKDELVVLRAQVRMVWINQNVQVGGVLGLELLPRHLALPEEINVSRHRLGHIRVPQGIDILETGHRTLAKEVAPVHDFLHGLAEINRLPPATASGPGALQHLEKAVGLIVGLNACLPLRAQLPIERGCLGWGSVIRDVRVKLLSAIRVPVYLHHHAVLNFDLYGAADLALQTGGVKNVLRTSEFIVLTDASVSGFCITREPIPVT